MQRSEQAQALTHLILGSVHRRVTEDAMDTSQRRCRFSCSSAVTKRSLLTQAHRLTADDARYLNRLQTSLELQVSPVTLSFDRRANAGSTRAKLHIAFLTCMCDYPICTCTIQITQKHGIISILAGSDPVGSHQPEHLECLT